MKQEIIELIRRAVAELPEDVEAELKKAQDNEVKDLPRTHLKNILTNIKLARDNSLPMCQDTGVPIFYVRLGRNIDPEKLKNIILEAVREATEKMPLRPNIVDCISRKNSGDNTGENIPYINWEFIDEDYSEITYMPKGAGSENVSALKMLKPTAGLDGIRDFIVETVKGAKGKPCPPVILGVGLGGSFDIAPKLAKKALLRPLNQPNKRQDIAALEKELLERINDLNIGPMGMGGKTTALKVLVESAGCHTASLPVAVNVQCWAHRKAAIRIEKGGVIFLGGV